MSLKSFDKFCENIILGEPKSQKVIFDERQKILRNQLTMEALIMYAAISAINTFIMEATYQWCESYFATLILAAAICLVWWTIRCAVNGALFGVNGTFSLKYVGIMWIVLGVCDFITQIFKVEYLFKDGMMNEKIAILVSCVLLTVCGIINLVAAGCNNKRHNVDE